MEKSIDGDDDRERFAVLRGLAMRGPSTRATTRPRRDLGNFDNLALNVPNSD